MKEKPRLSGYWDLTGNPIFINDTDSNFSWSKTAIDNDWCSGSGTWNNPYVIENVTIDGLSSASCITIVDSDGYFIIRNCTLFNSSDASVEDYAGIYLENVENGYLSDNNCSNNNGFGIFLVNSNNITLSKNLISYNMEDGIYVYESHNNTFFKNTVSYSRSDGIIVGYSHGNNFSINKVSGNVADGIALWYSHNNTLTNNTFLNRNREGITLRYCNNNTLYMNSISNCKNHGTRLWYGSNNNILSKNEILNNDGIGINVANSNKNKILANKVSSNDMIGIYIGDSNNNTISTNLVSHNNMVGIWLNTGANNTIFNNSLINNSPNGWDDDGTNNKWNKGKLGNFWDDYTGVDANDDGIGDTPYNISGTTGNQDPFPIWDDGSDMPGTFTLSSDAGTPDTDGNFNLIWTASAKTDNYSVYRYTSFISEINESLILLADQNGISPFSITDLPNGKYYFIIVAINENGQILSNCIAVNVEISNNGVSGYNLVFILSGILGIVVTLIIRRTKFNKN
ncbi:MAG: nitrous oxide reductase family maturation protein NosD [Promethearchaeota archaeon]